MSKYQYISDPDNRQQIIDDFHTLYYHDPETWPKNTFLGVPIQQNPIDMYLYQEMIFKTRPSNIIQTGVADGGSILYFAKLMDMVCRNDPMPSYGGYVIGIDSDPESMKGYHRRVIKLYRDSVNVWVRGWILGSKLNNFMVSLDSNHSYEHVLREIDIYSQFVGIGQYMVVEDTNINGHPVYSDFGPGPLEAVEEFLKDTKNFVRDDDLWKRQLMSHHQFGWLKRVS